MRNKNSKKRETKKYWKMTRRRLIYPDYKNSAVDDFYYKRKWFLGDLLMEYKEKNIKKEIRVKF